MKLFKIKTLKWNKSSPGRFLTEFWTAYAGPLGEFWITVDAADKQCRYSIRPEFGGPTEFVADSSKQAKQILQRLFRQEMMKGLVEHGKD